MIDSFWRLFEVLLSNTSFCTFYIRRKYSGNCKISLLVYSKKIEILIRYKSDESKEYQKHSSGMASPCIMYRLFSTGTEHNDTG